MRVILIIRAQRVKSMAEGRAVTKDSTCSVCLESFQEPKVLPCCHSFCLKCLEGILGKTKSKKKVVCPQCKTQHQVPPNGPQGFVDDYTIRKIDTKAKKPLSLLCDQCEERSKAVSYCPTCSEYLCEECLRAHKRLKAYRSHETISALSKKEHSIVKQQKKAYYCSLHPEEHLKLFCKACQSLACVHCFVGTHNGHDIGSIDGKTRKEVEKLIRDLVEETDSKLTEFEQNLQYISAVEKDKSEQSAPLKAEIDKKVDTMIAQLEARRAELHKEVDDAVTKDQKELWAQKEYHETNLVSLQGALSFARRSLNCQEDTELFALCAQITTRLKKLSQLKWDSQPTEKIEMTVMEFKEQPLEKEMRTTEFLKPMYRSNPSSHTTRSRYDLPDPKGVGKIYTTPSRPSLELIPNPQRNCHSMEYRQGCSTKFVVTAVIKIKGKTGHKNAVLTGSASFSMNKRKFNYQHRNQAVEVKEDTNKNSWTVVFNPSVAGRYHITFTARGKYGDMDVCNTYECDINVNEQDYFEDY